MIATCGWALSHINAKVRSALSFGLMTGLVMLLALCASGHTALHRRRNMKRATHARRERTRYASTRDISNGKRARRTSSTK